MRIARVTPAGMVHHVISRFIDKDWLITCDVERERYLSLLARGLSKTDWKCLAYAIMSSHIHLALLAGEQASERWSRRVNPPFVNWLNQRHGRIGPAIAGRATMWISRAEHVGNLIAYIHNNPVRAGVVARASESTWTSHRAYVGLVPRPAFLDVDSGLRLSGIRASSFDEWVHGERGALLEEPSLGDLRGAARSLGALELATPVRGPLEAPLVARPSTWIRPVPARVVEITAAVAGVGLGTLCSRVPGRGTVLRAVAVLAGRSFGVSMSAMGAALGVSAQGASRLAARNLDDVDIAVLRTVRDRIARDTEVRLKKEKASPGKGATSFALRNAQVEEGESVP